jgi:hypothetical protein
LSKDNLKRQEDRGCQPNIDWIGGAQRATLKRFYPDGRKKYSAGT